MVKINYPNNIKKVSNKPINYANRGMTLEDDLNITNNYYIEKDIAIIYKKPTPIQIVNKNNNVITKAYFKEPSTTDYNGIYKGKYIDFEAKETSLKTSFPLKNIHEHQIQHLKRIVEHQGIAFLIIRFTSISETYLLFGKDFFNYLDCNSKKSIPINYFRDKGYLIKFGLNPRIDYINIIEKYGGINENIKE